MAWARGLATPVSITPARCPRIRMLESMVWSGPLWPQTTAQGTGDREEKVPTWFPRPQRSSAHLYALAALSRVRDSFFTFL